MSARAPRLYRALLRLYPASFRAEYGEALCATFAERAERESGPLAPLRLAAAAVADVVPSALAVHLDVLRQDLRFTLRSLRRAPGFAITTVLVIALGVGANTAAFSVADLVLMRPLAFADPDRLVRVWQTTPGYGRMEYSPANFRDLREAAPSFEALGAYWGWATNLVGAGEPRRLETVRVTPGFLQLMGVPALAGRLLSDAGTDEGEVVLSHALWQSQFGGDPEVLGSTIQLDGAPHVVVGVMPPSFRFPDRQVEAWTPMIFGEEDYEDRSDTFLRVVGRLRPGASLERAQAEVAAVAARLERDHPETNRDTGGTVHRLRDEMSGRARLLVIALCGAALCILLLASANLAGLLMARARGRVRELAVRAALGAHRGRLVRQLVTESAVLTAAGGALGVGAAVAGMPLLSRLVPSSLPVAESPTADLRVLTLAMAFVALTGLGFGLAPALRAGRRQEYEALRGDTRAGGGPSRRLRAGLVVVEVAASVALLIASGLLVRAVWSIRSTDPGFRAEGVLAVRTALPLPKYGEVSDRHAFYSRVLEEVRALPGVRSAAYVTALPLEMGGGIWPVSVAGEELLREASNTASLRYVTGGYFSTMGVPLRTGRDVRDSDGQGAPHVAVVSESFAARHWPGESPLGKSFNFALADRVVVGVVGDVRVRGREQTSEPQVYIPHQQVPDNSIISYTPKELVVRLSVEPATLVPAIRRIVREVDPEQPVSHVRTLEEVVGEETAPRMTQLRVLALLSAIALLIAGVGIHGVLTLSVTQRSRELAVRRALGAKAGDVVGMVVREGMGLTLAGVLLGGALAYPAARAMQALLYGIPPGDPATLAGAAGLCLAAAALGCLRPALRVARIDPMSALRAE